MRHIVFQCFVVCSLLSLPEAATRPHYGGTLRVSLQSGLSTMQLSTGASPDEYWDTSRVLGLIADPLVETDIQGHARPALAIAWQSDSSFRRWQITLRRGVKFHDGATMNPAIVIEILSSAHPDWHMQPAGDSLIIESTSPQPFLLAELALPRNLILKRTLNGVPFGTGPFRVSEMQPGKMIKLGANEDCWAGRPYLDEIDIDLGKALRDQAIALELGRTDVIEASPATVGTATSRVRSSMPLELMTLVFTPNSRAQDPRVREALALAIDRKPILSVLLKGAGEPAASLLPNWMTGYASVFSVQPDLARARSLLAGSQAPTLTLSYDARDPQAQLLAERIALNGRDAGVNIQISLSGTDDMRLMRVVLPSPDPATSLREAVRQLGMTDHAPRSNAVDDLYSAERTLLDGHSLMPLFHLPIAAAASARVRNWDPDRAGNWDLQQVWLEAPVR